MNKKIIGKKGVVEAFSVIMFLAVIGAMGGVTYLLIQEEAAELSKYKYVGDIENKIVYPIGCLDEVKEDKRIIFTELAAAEELVYTFRERCTK